MEGRPWVQRRQTARIKVRISPRDKPRCRFPANAAFQLAEERVEIAGLLAFHILFYNSLQGRDIHISRCRQAGGLPGGGHIAEAIAEARNSTDSFYSLPVIFRSRQPLKIVTLAVQNLPRDVSLTALFFAVSTRNECKRVFGNPKNHNAKFNGKISLKWDQKFN